MDRRTAACVFLREQVHLEPQRFEALVLRLGRPESIWETAPLALVKTGLFSDEQLKILLKGRDQYEAVNGRLEELARSGLHTVSCFDADYPAQLLALSHPPSFLYRRGNDAASGPPLFVAGALAADACDITVAVAVGKRLAALGVVLVTNLSEGLETAVHVGALSGSGRHRVFLPCGHHAAAAWDSAPVLAQVSEAGAVYSEYAPDAKPNAHRRAEACRLAQGSAQGLLVLGHVDLHISAAVSAAATAGRPVFYLSGGDPDEALALRREGAYPVADPEQLERILPLL
jgi:DNA processing protein